MVFGKFLSTLGEFENFFAEKRKFPLVATDGFGLRARGCPSPRWRHSLPPLSSCVSAKMGPNSVGGPYSPPVGFWHAEYPFVGKFTHFSYSGPLAQQQTFIWKLVFWDGMFFSCLGVPLPLLGAFLQISPGPALPVLSLFSPRRPGAGPFPDHHLFFSSRIVLPLLFHAPRFDFPG